MKNSNLYHFAKDKLFGGHLEFRVRLFNVLAMIGTVISLYAAVAAIPDGLLNVVICLFGAGLSVGLMIFASRTKRYVVCYFITIIAIFLGLFPMLFFMGGGYVSSIPYLFILAIVFTVIMLEHRTALIMAALELVVYVGLFVFSYRHPETVIYFPTEEQLLFDVSLGLISVGSALALTVWFQFRLYNRQQKQLEDANKRLSELDRMKTEFVQSISHELKIPLSNIRNYALDTLMELKREQLDIPAMEYDQKVIRSEGQRLIRMVSQLLDVAAIEGGRLKIHKEQLSLASLLRRVVDGNRTVLEANGNRAALEIADGLPDLTADPDAVEQILLNLIGNAARHTKEGMITISLSAGGGYQEICVTDTGEGIHPDVQSQVFMRYIERENKMSGHNGLGLYICKKLIDAHGGEIGIESGREKGAAVWFRLPTDK